MAERVVTFTPGAAELRLLAHSYRTRASEASDAVTARILHEIAGELDLEASKLEGEGRHTA